MGAFGAATGGDAGNLSLSSSQYMAIDSLTGMPGTTLAGSSDSFNTATSTRITDSSPAGFTGLVTYTTTHGVIIVEQGGAQTYAASQSRDGQSNVAGGNQIILSSTDPAVTVAGGGSWQAFGKTVGLQYADFGIWNVSPTDNKSTTQAPVYAGAGGGAKPGVTETASLPTTGSASFTGGAAGYVIKGGSGGEFYGSAALTVNFTTGGGTVNGTISNINVYSLATNALMGSLNSIGFTGMIGGLGNTSTQFSGTATAQSGAGTAFDITGATGPFRGAFYGPGAIETAGTFQIRGTATQVFGGFGAKTTIPSDRRLKEAVIAAGHLANGLALYSWRYCGGRHRFTGVLAQDLLADRRFADAVVIDADGLMRVDYARIGYAPRNAAAMAAEGEAAVRRARVKRR